MSSKNREQNLSPIEDLMLNCDQYSFFQATRLIHIASLPGISRGLYGKKHECFDNETSFDKLRFTAHQSIEQNSLKIESVEAIPETKFGHDDSNGNYIWLINIQSDSITPPRQTLPDKPENIQDLTYTALHDTMMHQMLCMLFKSYQKKFPYSFCEETTILKKKSKQKSGLLSGDLLTGFISLLPGFNHSPSQLIDDDFFIYHASLIPNPCSPAWSLTCAIKNYFCLESRLDFYCGKKKRINTGNQLLAQRDSGLQPALGMGAVIGEHYTDFGSHFRITIQSSPSMKVMDFLKGEQSLPALKSMINIFNPPAFSYEIRVTVKDTEAPLLQLSNDHPLRLGRNTYMQPQGRHNKITTFKIYG